MLCLAGCKSEPIARQELVGRYQYESEDKLQNSTCFTLNADGTFVKGDKSFTAGEGPALPAAGPWQLMNEEHQQEIDLAHAGFPLRRHGSSIRALVDDDLGTDCELRKTQ
jgi:hypothetical protein